MNTRLKEFILQHTKKYDNGEIDYSEYLRKLNMLLTYINRKIDSELESNKDEYSREIIEYWKGNESKAIKIEILENFIENKKMKIYSDDIKKVINIESHNALEDVAIDYINIFGKNALKELNLKILSNSLEESYEDISKVVIKEYNEIKKEHEIRNLEGQLFNSDASYKGIEYIDNLSGFEFEDYLEELFIELGFETKELPYTNDYGADLIISKGFSEIVIQAKNYTGNVGNKAVQEVIAAKSHYKSDIGMVITNAYYTQNAITTAKSSDIILIDRDGLERILDEGMIYFNSLTT